MASKPSLAYSIFLLSFVCALPSNEKSTQNNFDKQNSSFTRFYSPQLFGPYKVVLLELKECVGFIPDQPAILKTEVVTFREKSDDFINATAVISTDFGPVYSVIQLFRWRNGDFTRIMRIAGRACDHFWPYFIMKVTFKDLSRGDCKIKKGTYEVYKMNLDKTIHQIIGERCKYDKYKFTLALAASQGTLSCYQYVLSFEKKYELIK